MKPAKKKEKEALILAKNIFFFCERNLEKSMMMLGKVGGEDKER
jgi:hypothetical protein